MNIWKRFLSLVVTASLLLGMIVYIPAATVEAAAATSPAETKTWNFAELEEIPADLTAGKGYSLSGGALQWNCTTTTNHDGNGKTMLVNTSGSENWANYIVTTEVTLNYNSTAKAFNYMAIVLYGDLQMRIRPNATTANKYTVSVYRAAESLNATVVSNAAVSGGGVTAEDVTAGAVTFKVSVRVIQGVFTVYIDDVMVCTYTYTGTKTSGTAGIATFQTSNAGCVAVADGKGDKATYRYLTVEPIPANEPIYNATTLTSTYTSTYSNWQNGWAEVNIQLPKVSDEQREAAVDVFNAIGAYNKANGTSLSSGGHANYALTAKIGNYEVVATIYMPRNSMSASLRLTIPAAMSGNSNATYVDTNSADLAAMFKNGDVATLRIRKVGNLIEAQVLNGETVVFTQAFTVAESATNFFNANTVAVKFTQGGEIYTTFDSTTGERGGKINTSATVTGVEIGRINKTVSVTVDSDLVSLPTYRDFTTLIKNNDTDGEELARTAYQVGEKLTLELDPLADPATLKANGAPIGTTYEIPTGVDAVEITCDSYTAYTVTETVDGLDVDGTEFLPGATVTITLAETLDPATLKVTYGETELTIENSGITETNDGYTFTMPASDVTIVASEVDTSIPEEGVIYDFADDTKKPDWALGAGYTWADGKLTWTNLQNAADDTLWNKNNGAQSYVTMANAQTWSDYVVSVDVAVDALAATDGNDYPQATLMLRHVNERNYIRIDVRPTQTANAYTIAVYDVVNGAATAGTRTASGSVTGGTNTTGRTTKSFNLKAKLNGNNLSVYIDNCLVWEGTVTTSAAGTVGVAAYTSKGATTTPNQRIVFDNFSITNVPVEYNVTEEVEGLEVDSVTAEANETVTITITDENLDPATLKVTYGETELTVGNGGITGSNGTYTFTMPASDVTITCGEYVFYNIAAGEGITVDATAKEGDTVTITITDENLDPATLKVTYGETELTVANGGITATDAGYTFTMPASDVTVTCNLAELDDEEVLADSVANGLKQTDGWENDYEATDGVLAAPEKETAVWWADPMENGWISVTFQMPATNPLAGNVQALLIAKHENTKTNIEYGILAGTSTFNLRGYIRTGGATNSGYDGTTYPAAKAVSNGWGSEIKLTMTKVGNCITVQAWQNNVEIGKASYNLDTSKPLGSGEFKFGIQLAAIAGMTITDVEVGRINKTVSVTIADDAKDFIYTGLELANSPTIPMNRTAYRVNEVVSVTYTSLAEEGTLTYTTDLNSTPTAINGNTLDLSTLDGVSEVVLDCEGVVIEAPDPDYEGGEVVAWVNSDLPSFTDGGIISSSTLQSYANGVMTTKSSFSASVAGNYTHSTFKMDIKLPEGMTNTGSLGSLDAKITNSNIIHFRLWRNDANSTPYLEIVLRDIGYGGAANNRYTVANLELGTKYTLEMGRIGNMLFASVSDGEETTVLNFNLDKTYTNALASVSYVLSITPAGTELSNIVATSYDNAVYAVSGTDGVLFDADKEPHATQPVANADTFSRTHYRKGETVNFTLADNLDPAKLAYTGIEAANVTVTGKTGSFVMPAGAVTVTCGEYVYYNATTEVDGITINPESAQEGDTVTVTLANNLNGATLKVTYGETELTVANGGITATDAGYTFTMPASDVTITCELAAVADNEVLYNKATIPSDTYSNWVNGWVEVDIQLPHITKETHETVVAAALAFAAANNNSYAGTGGHGSYGVTVKIGGYSVVGNIYMPRNGLNASFRLTIPAKMCGNDATKYVEVSSADLTKLFYNGSVATIRICKIGNLIQAQVLNGETVVIDHAFTVAENVTDFFDPMAVQVSAFSQSGKFYTTYNEETNTMSGEFSVATATVTGVRINKTNKTVTVSVDPASSELVSLPVPFDFTTVNGQGKSGTELPRTAYYVGETIALKLTALADASTLKANGAPIGATYEIPTGVDSVVITCDPYVTYTVTKDVDGLDVDVTEARNGDKVSITITDETLDPATLSVTGDNTNYTVGNGITDNGDGTYTFTMPASDVTITCGRYTFYNVTESVEGLDVDANTAKEGDTVIITITDETLDPATLSVTGDNTNYTVGNGITDNGDGTYTFTMPAENVTITCELAAVPDNDPVYKNDGKEALTTSKWTNAVSVENNVLKINDISQTWYKGKFMVNGWATVTFKLPTLDSTTINTVKTETNKVDTKLSSNPMYSVRMRDADSVSSPIVQADVLLNRTSGTTTFRLYVAANVYDTAGTDKDGNWKAVNESINNADLNCVWNAEKPVTIQLRKVGNYIEALLIQDSAVLAKIGVTVDNSKFTNEELKFKLADPNNEWQFGISASAGKIFTNSAEIDTTLLTTTASVTAIEIGAINKTVTVSTDSNLVKLPEVNEYGTKTPLARTEYQVGETIALNLENQYAAYVGDTKVGNSLKVPTGVDSVVLTAKLDLDPYYVNDMSSAEGWTLGGNFNIAGGKLAFKTDYNGGVTALLGATIAPSISATSYVARVMVTAYPQVIDKVDDVETEGDYPWVGLTLTNGAGKTAQFRVVPKSATEIGYAVNNGSGWESNAPSNLSKTVKVSDGKADSDGAITYEIAVVVTPAAESGKSVYTLYVAGRKAVSFTAASGFTNIGVQCAKRGNGNTQIGTDDKGNPVYAAPGVEVYFDDLMIDQLGTPNVAVFGEKQVTLKEDLAMDFHIALPAGSNASKAVITLNGEALPEVSLANADRRLKKVKLSNDVTMYHEWYVVTAMVPAKDINNTITVKLVDANGNTVDAVVASKGFAAAENGIFSYSVKEYAEILKDSPNSSATTVAAVKALLDYGTVAKTYFANKNGNTEDSYYDAAFLNYKATDEDVAKYERSAEGSIENISIYGASLVAEADTHIKIYFRSLNASAWEGVTVKVTIGNTEVTNWSLEDSDTAGYKYVIITGIDAANLDTTYTVTLTKGEGEDAPKIVINYSGLSYAHAAMSMPAERGNLIRLGQALYAYWAAANEMSK